MSKRYTQLTEAERYHIYTMKKQGYTDTVIAQGMGRDRTTIWRELHRNTGQRGYRHQQAQHWDRCPPPDKAQAGQADV